MNPTQIKQILYEIGGKANKTLGQNFLIDETALQTIVEAADIKKGDRILEVGPGLGVLTKELIGRGAVVTTIEKDRRFVDLITPLSQGSGGDCIPGDAAKLDWDELMGSESWKFVSNLPYSITSLALRKALYAKNPPQILVVLVQKEVAERIVARPASRVPNPKTSLLSLMVELAAGGQNAKIVRRVPPGAFYPSPKVDSAILKIVPTSHEQRATLWGIEPELVMQIAKKGFAHPRKLLFRNLCLTLEKWSDIATLLKVDEKVRAEDLSVEQWVELAKGM